MLKVKDISLLRLLKMKVSDTISKCVLYYASVSPSTAGFNLKLINCTTYFNLVLFPLEEHCTLQEVLSSKTSFFHFSNQLSIGYRSESGQGCWPCQEGYLILVPWSVTWQLNTPIKK